MSENGEIVKNGKGTAEVFNFFFVGKIVKNLNISQCSQCKEFKHLILILL